ncbi:sialate O-acetylesterase [Chitinophaga qingshengii]|uniref:Sialate O-acetylesterase domain-containing protein n=1 Tax=Chitinophaga qingshengii TaxID=1569794 RepID=A0ABR7THZ5_9BACT|nr:sialate O-acetylesterase [Chitinophaga qingshengii]MBC9929128.1 hypothetical protein [Chitinophaga qingshengii]
MPTINCSRMRAGKWLLIGCCMASLHAGAQHRSVFLAAGQSNAVGKGDQARSLICESGTAYEYKWKTDTLVSLKDPVGESYRQLEQAGTGSVWPAFAAAWHQRTGDTVIIVPAARGGASCHPKARLGAMDTWDTTGSLFEAAVGKTTAVLQKSKGVLKGIIWLQGERDANAINSGNLTTAEYQSALIGLIQRFRASLGNKVPFFIVQTGNYSGHPVAGFEEVRKAQQAVARKLPAVMIVYRDTPSFPTKKWMTDDIHYNQEGLNDIGRVIAKEIK